MHFTIPSAEGLPIRGDFDAVDNPRALVVIVHGFKGFKNWGFFPWLAQRLMGHRLAVCRFNMSRCGMGEDPESFDRLDLFEHDTYSIELADLHRAVQHAQQRFPGLPSIVLGHSRGGGMGESGDLGMMPDAELGELFPVPMRGERGHREAIGMTSHHVERGIADRSGSAKNADGARRHRKQAYASSAAAGMAASNASMRSRMPP